MVKISARKRPGDRQPGEQGILQVLRNEHAEAKRLLSRILKEREGSEETFSRIYRLLEAHMIGEEQLFYPEIEADESLRERVLEAYEEHSLGKILLNELEGMSQGDERWQAKLKVLGEVIGHHISEEEADVFPRARKLLGKEREARIARQYLEEKPEFAETAGAGYSPEEEEF